MHEAMVSARERDVAISTNPPMSMVRFKGDAPNARAITDRALEENRRLRLENARLRRERCLANVDVLTGMGNRSHFDQRLAEEFSRSRRFGLPLCLVVVDLANLKTIDETVGCGCGIRVLRRVAEMMLRNHREYDVACRIGTGELALLLPSTEHSGAQGLVHRLTQTLSHAMALMSLPCGVAIELDIGLAELPKDAGTPFELLIAAEESLHTAKRGRRQTGERTEAA